MKRSKRPHHRVLDDIFGVGAIALEPHRKTEQTIRVRQDLCLEGTPGV
jgi:hypothetical protein